MQEGELTPCWEWFLRLNSAPDCPIKAKFALMIQNQTGIGVTWLRWHTSKIQDGGRLPFWKWYSSILMKFGTQKWVLILRRVMWWKFKISLFRRKDDYTAHSHAFRWHRIDIMNTIAVECCWEKIFLAPRKDVPEESEIWSRRGSHSRAFLYAFMATMFVGH